MHFFGGMKYKICRGGINELGLILSPFGSTATG
jgi:hypothetical protein